jgi:hypothetical protein
VNVSSLNGIEAKFAVSSVILVRVLVDSQTGVIQDEHMQNVHVRTCINLNKSIFSSITYRITVTRIS